MKQVVTEHFAHYLANDALEIEVYGTADVEGKGKRRPSVINMDASAKLAASGALQHMGQIGEGDEGEGRDSGGGVDSDAPGADVFTQLSKELEETKQHAEELQVRRSAIRTALYRERVKETRERERDGERETDRETMPTPFVSPHPIRPKVL